MEGKKVILLGPYPPPYGGVSIYISTLFEHLEGHGVFLWTFGGNQPAGANVRYMKDKRRELVPLLIKEASHARILDCSHFLLEYPSIMIPLWSFLKVSLSFEWVKIVHDGSLPARHRRFTPLQRVLFGLAVKSITEFIVVSEELKQWLLDEVKVKQTVTHIKSLLPMLRGTTDLDLPVEMENQITRYLGHTLRVCSIGAFIEIYGFDQVADAVERVRRDTGENIGLILIAGTFIVEEGFKARVLAERDWITVVEDVPHPVTLQILKRSSLFVRAFESESYGLSRVEAIWSNVPVIATKAGETRGMRTYDYGDVDELARLIKSALFEVLSTDMERWSEMYRREAEENLKRLLRKIGIKSSETRFVPSAT